jgi:hypothetical protein
MIVLKLLLTIMALIIVLLPIHLATGERFKWLDIVLMGLVASLLGLVGGLAIFGTYVIWTRF